MEFKRVKTQLAFNEEEKRTMRNFVSFAENFLDEMYDLIYEDIYTDNGIITVYEFEEIIEKIKSILESKVEVE